MSIRTKILQALCLVLCLTVILTLIGSVTIFRYEFGKLEEQMARDDCGRVLSELKNQLNAVNTVSQDWATWDETYQFARQSNAAFLKTETSPTSLSIIHADLFAIYNSAGTLIALKCTDTARKQDITCPPGLKSALTAWYHHPNRSSERKGVLVYPAGILLLAAHPILTTRGNGPPTGILVIGRLLDPGMIKEISTTTNLQVSFSSTERPDFADHHAAELRTQRSQVLVRRHSSRYITGYTSLPALNTPEALFIRIIAPRTISQHGQQTIIIFIGILLALGVIMSLFAMFLLDRMVLSRLESLCKGIRRIGSSVDFSARVPVTGHDELTQVGKAVNDMLTALELSIQRAMDLIPLPVIFTTMDHNVSLANHAAVQVGGTYGFSSLQDLHLREPDEEYVSILQERYLPEPEKTYTWQEYIDQICLKEDDTATREVILLSPDKRKIPMLLHVAPVMVEGKQAGRVIACQDISPLKEADRAKIEFLAVSAHELLTPLTSIIGWAEMARDSSDPTLIAQAIEVIFRNSKRQKRLVDNLLDSSRLIHGKLFLQPQMIDILPIVEQASEACLPKANERKITLSFTLSGQPMFINADRGRIRQVIDHLLANALKFSEAGDEISIVLAQEEREVVLSVRDTGRGISPDGMANLFKPFKQLERDEEKGGLGIGLVLTKGIVELHDGSIQVKSPGPGQGSTFTIRLPLVEQPVLELV